MDYGGQFMTSVRDLEEKFPEYGLINSQTVPDNEWIIPEYLPWRIGFVLADPNDKEEQVWTMLFVDHRYMENWYDLVVYEEYLYDGKCYITEIEDIQPALESIKVFAQCVFLEDVYEKMEWTSEEVTSDSELLKMLIRGLTDESLRLSM